VRTLSDHTSAVWSAVFSPDGKHVLTRKSLGGTARLWEADYHDFVADVCARLLQDFTEEERTLPIKNRLAHRWENGF
jgi:WD40 repeat protein